MPQCICHLIVTSPSFLALDTRLLHCYLPSISELSSSLFEPFDLYTPQLSSPKCLLVVQYKDILCSVLPHRNPLSRSFPWQEPVWLHHSGWLLGTPHTPVQHTGCLSLVLQWWAPVGINGYHGYHRILTTYWLKWQHHLISYKIFLS